MKKFIAVHGCTYGETPVVWIFEALNLAWAKEQARAFFLNTIGWKGDVQVACLDDFLDKMKKANKISAVICGLNFQKDHL